MLQINLKYAYSVSMLFSVFFHVFRKTRVSLAANLPDVTYEQTVSRFDTRVIYLRYVGNAASSSSSLKDMIAIMNVTALAAL